MDDGKYNRNIALNCPTCGGTQFSGAGDDASEFITCSSCSRILTRSELVRENSESISEHLKEIKTEALRDVSKQIKETFENALKGSTRIRIK